MAIESEDLVLFKRIRSEVPKGSSCAILGDCNIQNGNLEYFAKTMGFERVDTFDVNGTPTHKFDLNEKLPEKFYDLYDWVIDSGTLYCCFDISTVWENILNMLKTEGCIIHTGNLSGFFGRGFYSLSPALFRDFYTLNNFEILYMGTKSRQSRQWAFSHPTHTYLHSVAPNGNMLFQNNSGNFISTIPNDCMIMCVSRRKSKIQFKKPIPRHFINTKGH